MSRVILLYPGGQLTLFRYRRDVPIQQATDKLARIASELFESWQWGDADIPAIESIGTETMLLLVQGQNGKECFL